MFPVTQLDRQTTRLAFHSTSFRSAKKADKETAIFVTQTMFAVATDKTSRIYISI